MPNKIDAFITLYQNPEMAELVVESINNADKPRDMCIWGFFEYGFDPKLEKIFDNLEGVELKKIKRDRKYGINWNTPRAFIETAEKTKGEYIICLQSDIIVSKDFFRYLDYGISNFDVGYVFGLATIGGKDDDSAVSIKCHPGWYGHWGVAVKTDIILEYYRKYLGPGYPKDVNAHAKKYFPDIKCGGSDYFIARFLFENKISGMRPSLTRTMNIGITGEHIRLKGAHAKTWKKLNREEKLSILRCIIKEGKYKLKSNFNLEKVPRILRDYNWEKLKLIKVDKGFGKHTGTDLT